MINNLFGNASAAGASSSNADSSNKQDIEQAIIRDEDAAFQLPLDGEDDHKKKNKTMEKTSTTATSMTTKVNNNEDRRCMTTAATSTKDDDTTKRMTTAVVVAVDGEDVEAQTPQQQLQEHINMLDRLFAPFERCCVGASEDITKLSSSAAAAVLSAVGGAGNSDENGGGCTTTNNMIMDGKCIGAAMCPFESDTPTIKGDDDSSLADLAAKMRMIDSMDSETVKFDDRDDDNKSTTTNNKNKNQFKWYRDPVHLTIFILCVLFSIAIVVLAILLIVSSK
mmetsp:Transcript_37388/g.90875  ORF Transcript_37388/g.90875 Transcript_37388/m.90875 type:complete len:280 (-) Transcript_37388:596-1435(-)|eukprot:CAMPEP_0113484636 /NCGR_PEP_ID=MMETSP0014_2-20120614/24065_1 /TAXON_ID=2857 /ORGANISM="Nitzschia sp." /LENGTH=279 /DNA_ID=CAMNT_0000378247 /DNA_START=196 /DNA_END=1035 /DNA_ORIENTATION=+ /assembly_acc=CAM_ASM_000159